MAPLNDKELTILSHIARNSLISQRQLSSATGISLGLVNVLLGKFLKAGYLKVSQLNKRKLEYFLTPSGFVAVARKTYQYATRTIRDYHQLHSQLSDLLAKLHESGFAYFSVHGDGELRDMIEAIAPRIFDGRQAILGSEHRDDPGAVVLNVTAEAVADDFDGHVVSVLERLEGRG